MKRNRKLHIWPEPLRVENNTIIARATIEAPDFGRKSLWYRLPVEYRYDINQGSNDPYLLAMVFPAMRHNNDIHVHGEVSPSLLNNLQEFRSIWNLWYPELYAAIDIQAEVENEHHKAKTSAVLAAFSGGVDSSFMVWRHKTGGYSKNRRDIQAGVMFHGFEIPLDRKEDFKRAAMKAEKLLNSPGLGIPLITISSNIAIFWKDWQDLSLGFMASVVSGMNLLKNGYSEGIIANSLAYKNLSFPTPSSILTDVLLSSDSFRIIHDGGALSRNDKIRELANWPDALRYLRVCTSGADFYRNCGKCEKCVRTILNFRAAGVQLPPCFDQDVSNMQIIKIYYPRPQILSFHQDIVREAALNKINDPWVRVLQLSILKNKIGLRAKNIPWVRSLYRSISR
ncbi:hypothetical protein ACFLUA_03370 [Chloroflexota bacterium]